MGRYLKLRRDHILPIRYFLSSILSTLNEYWVTESFFFFYCHYNPLWALALSVIFFHSALSWHCFLYRHIPIICVSSSISTIRLFLGLLSFSYLQVSTLIFSWVFPCHPSASRDLAKLFFCFYKSYCLRFLLVRSVRNSFWFSRIHLHFELGQRFLSIF
jgi:hypothetical protein